MAVFSWGSNRDGQLGHQPVIQKTHRAGVCSAAMEVLALARLGVSGSISTVAAGASHSLAVSEFGDVYSWGRNKEGACGQGMSFLWVHICDPVGKKAYQKHVVSCNGKGAIPEERGL